MRQRGKYQFCIFPAAIGVWDGGGGKEWSKDIRWSWHLTCALKNVWNLAICVEQQHFPAKNQFVQMEQGEHSGTQYQGKGRVGILFLLFASHFYSFIITLIKHSGYKIVHD